VALCTAYVAWLGDAAVLLEGGIGHLGQGEQDTRVHESGGRERVGVAGGKRDLERHVRHSHAAGAKLSV
jgi:hypothetical protein